MTAIEIPCAPAFSLLTACPAVAFAQPASKADSEGDSLLGSNEFFPIDSLPRRCICTTRIVSRDGQMECTKTIALVVHSVDHPAFFLAPAFFPIHSLPRRCICTTRVESRDSPMDSTKTIALIIHSLD